ncbi:MAG: hypothetical protein CBC35_11220 [Planctomycetes bacterium TMED75]|nr:hypothetical protein [Planctomycetaceae bacterium]OUU90720.1 MAG: hypothetical protein CBC35_11220 [Planctomycetes bacterium TMED75]
MHRLNLLFVALFSCGTAATLDAAPPTEQDWWTGFGRYVGTFDLVTDQSDEPSGQFTMRWEEPFKLTDYAFHGAGDTVEVSSGFGFWNASTKRAEFTEIEEGPEGRLVYDGYCSDMTATTMTWKCRAWDSTGVVRTFTVVDTMDANGDFTREIKDVTGKPFPMKIIKWTRANGFLHHFPGAEDFVGTWNSTENGQKVVTVIEWGPGKRSLHESDHRVNADGSKTLIATCAYLYDEQKENLYAHYINAQGVSAWANPTVTSDGSTHTLTMDWAGTAKGSDVSVNVVCTIDGKAKTVTNHVSGFTIGGVPVPDGPVKQAMEETVVMTRQK